MGSYVTSKRNGRKRVLVIFIDGCRPDALLSANAPALKGLALQGGAFSFHVDCGPIALSAPSWATIVTGTPASQHLLDTNDVSGIYRDEAGALLIKPFKACICPSSTVPGKELCALYRRGIQERAVHFPPSIFSRLAMSGKRSALIMQGWNGVGVMCGGSADFHREKLENGHFQTWFFPSNDDLEEATKVTKNQICQPDGPDLVAIFIDVVDAVGHANGFGLDVPEYIKAIEIADGSVAQLLGALNLELDDWLVAVTTDHGGTPAYLPAYLRDSVLACGCLQAGSSQAKYRAVHGNTQLRQDTQTFQIFAHARSLQAGEILPAPDPLDFAPTVLQQLVDEDTLMQAAFPGKVKGFHAESGSDMVPPPPQQWASRTRKNER